MAWGLALCGGGIRCGAQLGALRVLLQAGWSFDVVAGSSSGSIAGAMYALGLSTEQMERELSCNPRRLFGFQPGRWGLGNSARFRRWLRDLVGGARLEELPRRLIVTATDITHARPHYFTKGDLADALYASSALPGLFDPVVMDGSVLADGCMLSPLPVEPLRAAGADRVLGIQFADQVVQVRTLVDLITRSFHAMMAHQAARQATEVDLLLTPTVGQYHIRDARNLQHCIAAGEAAAREALVAWAADPMSGAVIAPPGLAPPLAPPPPRIDTHPALIMGPP